ncbi:MAG TPA: hypothetical protein VF420_13335 [Casimicrobiaceae bacterium]
MAARFNPIVCQIGNDISLSVRAERDCVVRAVVLTEPAPDYATSKTLREVHELLQRYEQQAASDNRRIADLVLELEHLRRELRPTEPAPTQSIDERCEQTALGVRCILARGHSGSHMGNGPGGWKDDDNDNGAWMTPTDES